MERLGLTDRQLRMRRTGVGASEISALVERAIPNIVGFDENNAPIVSGTRVVPVSPYEDQNEVYWRKVPPYIETVDYTNALLTGIFFEAGVIDWYCHDQNVKVHRAPTRRHPKHGWMLATRDRVVMDGGKPVRNVEAKVVMDYRPRKAAPPGLSDEWQEWYSWGDDADAVPQHYRLQVEQQMEVTGIEETDLVVFFCLRRELKIYRIRKNARLAEQIISAGERFWHSYVKAGVEPEKRWLGADSAMEWLKLRYAEYDDALIMAPEEAREWAIRYQRAHQDAKNAETLKEEAKARLCMMIGDHAGLRGDFGECTWKERVGGIDYKGIAEHFMKDMSPEAASAMLENFRRNGQRTFLCKLNKPESSWPET